MTVISAKRIDEGLRMRTRASKSTETNMNELTRDMQGTMWGARIVDACTRHNCSLKTLCVMRQSFILVVANLGS